MKKKWLFILIGAAVIAAVVYLVVKARKKKRSGSTPGLGNAPKPPAAESNQNTVGFSAVQGGDSLLV